MRRSLPRLARARLAARSPLRRRSSKNIESQAENRSIHTRLLDLEEGIYRRPIRILEAHLHAKVEVLPRKPLRTAAASYDTRPRGRRVPAGTVMHVPNAYTPFGRQKYTPGDYFPPIDITTPSNTRRPSFRRPADPGHNLYESYLQTAKSSTKPRTVGESNRLLRPAFRRAYSSMASPVASSSKVRIEDMEEMESGTAQFTEPPLSTTLRIIEGHASPVPGIQDTSTQVQASPSSIRDVSTLGSRDDIDYLGRARLMKPESSAHMVGILRQAVRMMNSPKLSTLEYLHDWHNRYPGLRTTASFNILLQLAYDIRNFKAFNQILLQDMPEAGVKRDRVTYDLEMESFARHGHWRKVVASWTARQKDGIPLNAIGWTRLLQAVTKRGTTSLNRDNIGTTMSPIYSALYDLPKGVRQMQLHRISMAQKMDVDQMLSLMMPEDLQPLDFYSTLAIAHRLAKQLRWREAEDVVALYLDRTAASWYAEVQQTHESATVGMKPARAAEPITGTMPYDTKEAHAKSRREQSALALLHVLLECLVVSRSTPAMIQAYIDNYLVRYENTGVAPKYHTLFFVLSAYRSRPLASQFREAYEHFISLETEYQPPSYRLTDRYGLSRCLRQLQNYGHVSLKILKKQGAPEEVLSACEFDLANVKSRLAEIGELDQEWRFPKERRIQALAARQPRRHILLKEKYKARKTQYGRPECEGVEMPQVDNGDR